MNIFFLSTSQSKCAEYLHDRHVVKMTTETAQLICTYINAKMANEDWMARFSHLIEPSQSILYKSTHQNHPCQVWLRESEANFCWLVGLLESLIQEYDHRFKRASNFFSARNIHTIALRIIAQYTNANDEALELTLPALAMPPQYKVLGGITEVIKSYRHYYAAEKIFQSHVKWTRRELPYWLNDSLEPRIMERVHQLTPRKIPLFTLNQVKWADTLL